MSSFIILLMLCAIIGGTYACNGCVELDNLTFDRVVSRFPDAALVKFDIAFPYGPKHEEFAEFAAEMAVNVPQLLVAIVGVKDYGDRDNADLAERFQVGTIFPVLRLFPNGTEIDRWIAYPERHEITSSNLKMFVSEHTKLYIGSGCSACLRDMDELAAKMIVELNARRNDAAQEIDGGENIIMTEMEKKSEMYGDGKHRDTAKVYMLIMKRVQSKGTAFVKSEIGRVELLVAGKLPLAKRVELQLRLDILKSIMYAVDNFAGREEASGASRNLDEL